MSTFGDREFGVTPVRGVRTFRVTADGRLYGATGYEWTPGVNVARCHTGALVFKRGLLKGRGVKGLSARDNPIEAEGHDMADCTCGFYAYHDGVGDFAVDPRGGWIAHGVVEGSGKTTIGERGFRTERARVLGLSPPRRVNSTFERCRRAIVSVFVVYVIATFLSILDIAAVPWIPSVLAAYLVDVVEFTRSNAVYATTVLAAVGYVSLRRSGGWTGAFHREASAPAAPLDEESSAVVAALRERYPDVEVLPSLAELLATHPPDRRPSA